MEKVLYIVRSSTKSIKCEDDGLITQANAQGVVSNTRGSSVCHGDGVMMNMCVVHKGGIWQDKGGLDQWKDCIKWAFDCALIKARYKEKGEKLRHQAGERQWSSKGTAWPDQA